jgi:hypothetical protein
MKKTFAQYPRDTSRLAWFMPEAKNALALPAGVPGGIATEFREAEHCLGVGASRAAAVMFRSVLDKTFRHNGYKKGGLRSLNDQIDAAVTDGVITEARRQRAHEDVRVLGNDVLHDEWRPLEAADVEPAHHYTQRILEDFYADREVVLEQLRAKGRVPEEDVGGSGE